MRDAEIARAAPAPRTEGEPHLTFEVLLADTLQEMDAHEHADGAVPDETARLGQDVVAALRAEGVPPLVRPFFHSYLTPISTPALSALPGRLDVRS